MSSFISHDSYASFEHLHGGWEACISLITQVLGSRFVGGSQIRILEMGPGPGTSTKGIVQALRPLLGANNFSVDCVDNDPEGIEKLKCLVASLDYPEIHPILADGATFVPTVPYDSLVSVFAVSHLRDHEKREFLLRLQTVTKDGLTFIADEFLPDMPNETNAYWNHHSTVIFDALIKGNIELAKLELEALHSGLHGIGDFKVTNESFERLVTESKLDWGSVKCFPIEGDLTPLSKGTTLAEAEAQKVWIARSPLLLEAVLDRQPRESLFPSISAVSQLEWIFEEMRACGCTTLRDKSDGQGLSPNKTYDVELATHVSTRQRSGVYLYTLGQGCAHQAAIAALDGIVRAHNRHTSH